LLLSSAPRQFARPPQVPLWAVVVGLGLFAVFAVSTASLQAPQHQALSGGFDRGAYEFLPSTNWIRTAAWSTYEIFDLWMMWQVA
jgi:hypothetical protein